MFDSDHRNSDFSKNDLFRSDRFSYNHFSVWFYTYKHYFYIIKIGFRWLVFESDFEYDKSQNHFQTCKTRQIKTISTEIFHHEGA